jgi:hypothetical protein
VGPVSQRVGGRPSAEDCSQRVVTAAVWVEGSKVHARQVRGFIVEALYGDFYRQPLGDTSTDMIWVAQKA